MALGKWWDKIRDWRRSRHVQVFGVGMAKTGTHSLASLFQGHFRAAHEPDSTGMIRAILQKVAGGSPTELRAYLRQRDRRLRLEIDSSQLNYFVLDELLDLFPRRVFILTMRDCVSWLDSLINHSLARPASGLWLQIRDIRFGQASVQHPLQEQVLADRGLYTLDGYLRYWAVHNAAVLERVPADRLLVIKTQEIASRGADIAAFLGIPSTHLRPEAAHAYQALQRHHILDQIPAAHLADQVRQHRGALMARYFPQEYQQIGGRSALAA